MKLLLMLTISFFFGCSQRQEKIKHVVYKVNEGVLKRIEYSYNDSNEILSITPLNKDSLPNGVEIFYYKNGIDSVINNWEDGKRVGAKIQYYKNGNPQKYQFVNLRRQVYLCRHRACATNSQIHRYRIPCY